MKNGSWAKIIGKSRRFMAVSAVVLLSCLCGATNDVIMNNSSVMAMSPHVAVLPKPEEGEHGVSSAQQPTSSNSPSSQTDNSSAVQTQISSTSPSSQNRTNTVTSVTPSGSNYVENPALYQAMCPNLYVPEKPVKAIHSGKVVYLTFDDGPSNLTLPLLDVLDRYHVKATFFLVGKTDPAGIAAIKETAARGHAIGVHSYTHNFRQIYQSTSAFLEDFSKMHDLILKTTGIDTHIYRFAGGSVNDFNHRTAKSIIHEMNRRGYTYFDWNVSSGDAQDHYTAASVYRNVINGVHRHSQSVILCHNTGAKGITLSQVPKIIQTLQNEGYQFETLDQSVDNEPYIFPIQF